MAWRLLSAFLVTLYPRWFALYECFQSFLFDLDTGPVLRMKCIREALPTF